MVDTALCYLLILTTSASAECSWVMWQQDTVFTKRGVATQDVMTTGAERDTVILGRGGIVNSVWIVFAVGVVLAGVGFVPAVYGQEAKPPADIRMLLSQPQNRVGVDATAGPDLRDLPQPKMDKPPVVPPIRITVGDPHCRPGEDSPEGFNGIPRSRRYR